MKIVIITQEDAFVIPRNIQKINAIKDVKILGIVDIDSKSSLAK